MSDEQWRAKIIHGLRSQGWSRIEAENEADDRIERRRQEIRSAQDAHHATTGL